MTRRILINGHGWSGSSAFIDLLRNADNESYFVVPGEFDDFRVPGTLRELVETKNIPKSRRARKVKTLFKLKLRQYIKDSAWPASWPAQDLTQKHARDIIKTQRIEKHAFNKCLKRSKNFEIPPQANLKYWFDQICDSFASIYPSKQTLFFEQAILFDDKPEIYQWLDFDKLILFIRPPSKQLQATFESITFYDDYPWSAEFLIGSAGSRSWMKQVAFLNTTIQRYQWIIEFLATVQADKVIIVNFDSFLYDFDSTLNKLSSIIDINLSDNAKRFSLASSQSRDREWSGDEPAVVRALTNAEQEFYKFKRSLSKIYEVI